MDEPCEGYVQMLKELSKSIKRNYAFKKSDFYNENAPSWLADEFDIKWIKYTDLVDEGVKFLMPYNEFISAPVIIDNNKKHDTVIMWVGKKKGEERIDINLTNLIV